MTRRGWSGLLLLALLVVLLVARRASHADRAREAPHDRPQTTADPPDPDPPMDVVREGATSASVFASFQIDGMVWHGVWPRVVKSALSGRKRARNVWVSYPKKMALVEYEPGKTSVGQLIDGVRQTIKYAASLKGPVETRLSTEIGAWKVRSLDPCYAPASKGRLIATLSPSQRGSVAVLRAAWSGEEGLSVTSGALVEDLVSGVWTSTADFQIARELPKDELVARVTLTYRVEAVEGEVTLEAVVPVPR